MPNLRAHEDRAGGARRQPREARGAAGPPEILRIETSFPGEAVDALEKLGKENMGREAKQQSQEQNWEEGVRTAEKRAILTCERS